MNRLLACICVTALACSFCSAEGAKAIASPRAPEKPAVAKPQAPASLRPKEKLKTAEGVLDSSSMADTARGTKSEIFVSSKTNGASRSMNLLIKSTTTIYDASGKALTLDKLVRGSMVKVKYATTPEGVTVAVSVTVTDR